LKTEDFHGFHPVQIDGHYYLEFSGPAVISSRNIDLYEYHNFLKSWITKRNEYLSGPEEREDTKYEKRKN
jgi:hypothetical protein